MKKLIIIIIAALFSLVCFDSTAADNRPKHPKHKGFGYMKHERARARANKKQMHQYRNTGGHVCTGDKYSRGRR